MSTLPVSYLTRLRDGSLTKKNLVTRGCLNPKQVQFKCAADISTSVQFFDCGRCINCMQSRRDDWTSRMCLHSLSHKYCYFITLTYGSYDLSQFKQHPFLADWLETAPGLDSDNSFHAPRYTPSLLIASHLQKFLKRLRILVGDNKLSFAACGEYGRKHGRPHFHVILWSDLPVTRAQVVASWSLMCVKTGNPRIIKSYRNKKTPPELIFPFRIGRVDFVDLVENGSLDWNSSQPVKDENNATRCFSYVAKYLYKDFVDSMPESALRRIRNIFPLLDDSQHISVDYESGDSKFYKQYLLNSTPHEKVSFVEFLAHVSPFFRTSRKYSLAKDYYLQNRARFQAGNYSLPSFCGRQLSFPRYYYRLLSLDEYPLRLHKIVSSGTSFSKGDYQSLIYYFVKLSSDRNSFLDIFNLIKKQKPTSYHVAKLFSGRDVSPRWYDDYTDSTKNGNILELVFLSSGDSPFYVKYSWSSDSFDFYRYDSHIREYVFHHYEERVDFCNFVITQLRAQIQNYNGRKSLLSAKYELDYLVKGSLTGDSIDFSNPDSVSEFEELSRLVDVYLKNYKQKQIKYHNKHLTGDLQ